MQASVESVPMVWVQDYNLTTLICTKLCQVKIPFLGDLY